VCVFYYIFVMKKVLSIYGCHDASVTFVDRGGRLRIYEYERHAKVRNAMYSERHDVQWKEGTNDSVRGSFIERVKADMGGSVDLVLHSMLTEGDMQLMRGILGKDVQFKFMDGHHEYHMVSGYSMSGYDRACVVSVDGGGPGRNGIEYSKFYIVESGEVVYEDVYDIDFGGPYGWLGSLIDDIVHGDRHRVVNLVYSGKLMGMSGYGRVREEWVEGLMRYYCNTYGIVGVSSIVERLMFLCKDLGIKFGYKVLVGHDAYDLVATSQYVFEQLFFDMYWDNIVKSDMDVVLVGGCAMNILLAQKLRERLEGIGRRLYIPCIPNDANLSLGQYISYSKYKIDGDIVYNGIGIDDLDMLTEYVDKYGAVKVNIGELVDIIGSGGIVGIIQGDSELGPRALGNRSIVCNSCDSKVKDKLNFGIKFREWYRPFAPVCRQVDMHKYFDKVGNSEYMSYSPYVKNEYRDILKAVTHIDGSARLQTVTDSSHRLFYDILNYMDSVGMVPVILNTSFNIKGKPILNSIYDALMVMNETQLDYVYCEGFLFKKMK